MPEEINKGMLPTSLRGSDYLSGWVSPIPDEILLPGGDWKAFAASSELQRTDDGRDEMACVIHAALNALETLAAARGYSMPRLSRRAIAKLSETTVKGNSFQAVWDAIRKYGLIPEALCPDVGKNWDDYYGVVISEAAFDAGARSLEIYDIGYEFIAFISEDTLHAGLERGPLQVSIGDDVAGVETHSVVMLNDDTSGRKDVIDSEIPGIATLPATRRIYAALRPHLVLKTPKPMPRVLLADRCLVTVVMEDGLLLCYHKAGNLIVDDANVLVQRWIAENEKDGMFNGGPVRTITKADYESFTHVNLKGQAV